MSHLSCPSRWAPESCHQHPPRVCRLQVEDPKGHISKVLCSAWALRLQGAEHRLTAALDQRILTSWCRSSASPRARAPPHPSGPRAGSEPTSPPPPRPPRHRHTHEFVAAFIHVVLQVAAAVVGSEDGAQLPVSRKVEAVIRGKHQQSGDVAPADLLLTRRGQVTCLSFPRLGGPRQSLPCWPRGCVPPTPGFSGGQEDQRQGPAPRGAREVSVGRQAPRCPGECVGHRRDRNACLHLHTLWPSQLGPGATSQGDTPKEEKGLRNVYLTANTDGGAHGHRDEEATEPGHTRTVTRDVTQK